MAHDNPEIRASNLSPTRWLRLNWWQVALVTLCGYATITYRQHLLALEANARSTERRVVERAYADSVQHERVYVAKRRNECYDIFVQERNKWSNVEGPEYELETDMCRIRYKSDTPPKKNCGNSTTDSTLGAYMMKYMRDMYVDCVSGTYTRTF